MVIVMNSNPTAGKTKIFNLSDSDTLCVVTAWERDFVALEAGIKMLRDVRIAEWQETR